MLAWPERFEHRHRNPLIAFRCDCNSGHCYKVMRYRTMQKRSAASRLRCPAHQKCPTHSEHVENFAHIAIGLNSNIRFVWDMKCFPGDAHRSIDAIVLSGYGRACWCSCFEIDGSIHFSANLTCRDDRDAQKDQKILDVGCGLMRLHYKDDDVWEKYISLHMLKPDTGLRYTDSYVHCMGQVPEIIRSRNL